MQYIVKISFTGSRGNYSSGQRITIDNDDRWALYLMSQGLIEPCDNVNDGESMKQMESPENKQISSYENKNVKKENQKKRRRFLK